MMVRAETRGVLSDLVMVPVDFFSGTTALEAETKALEAQTKALQAKTAALLSGSPVEPPAGGPASVPIWVWAVGLGLLGLAVSSRRKS